MLSLALVSCGSKQSGMPQAGNDYAVVTLKTTEADLYTSYPATIKGQQDIEIRPKVSGHITKLCVDEGDFVKKGQPLFLIDRVQYEAAVRSAEANVNVLQANLNTQKLTVDNKRALHDKAIISDYDYEMAQNQLKATEAQLAQAKAQLVSARNDLSFCTVTSPADGVVGEIPYRVGSLVSSSTAEALTTVSNISKMPIDISPLNTTTNVTGAYGCDSRQPARGNGSVYYSSCANRQVWCLTETYYGPQFVNASLYCDHLFRCGIRRMAWQSAPEPRLHVVLQDGTMAVLVANSSGSMSAWCHWSTKVGKVRDIAVLDTENGQDVYLLVEESDTSSGIYVLDETLFDDGDDVAIEGRVVLNPVDGGATINRYKYAGVFHVDSMGTKFTVGQNGVVQASSYSGYDYDLTRVSAPAVPGHTYRIEIDNVPHEDWTVLCVYTEAEVS